MNSLSNYQTVISACGICHGTASYPLENKSRDGTPLGVVVCGKCAVVHNHPIPTAEELSQFYATEYRPRYKGTRQPKLRHAARYFSASAAHIRENWQFYKSVDHLLDVGSGSGEFLYLMGQMGKHATGLEPSHDYSQFCRNTLGLDITTGEIGSFAPSRKFDHIRLCHVVEHLRDPVGSLKQMSSWLNEGGSFYIAVPDFDSYCRTKSSGGMFHYGHIYNFDAASFERMLTLAGLRLVKRVGATAGFAEVASPARELDFDTTSEIKNKLDLYATHRNGTLRKKPWWRRLTRKATNRTLEYGTVLLHPGYTVIGMKAANELKTSLFHEASPAPQELAET